MKIIRRKRAFVLVGVLAVMLLLVGVMAVLAHSAIGLHESRKHATIERTARLLAESGLAYARSHEEEWRKTAPAAPVEPDVEAIMPPRMTGTLQITFEPSDDGLVCRVQARVERSGVSFTENRELVLE